MHVPLSPGGGYLLFYLPYYRWRLRWQLRYDLQEYEFETSCYLVSLADVSGVVSSFSFGLYTV